MFDFSPTGDWRHEGTISWTSSLSCLQRFTCQISAFKPTEIHHDLVVRTRPVLAEVTEEVTVTEGSSLSLECEIVSGESCLASTVVITTNRFTNQLN